MNSVVDHVAILVDDLEEAEKWYAGRLGGEITHRQENYIRLKLQNTNIALLSKKFDTSKSHIGILCENIENLVTRFSRLTNKRHST